jgi:hypothetical protein
MYEYFCIPGVTPLRTLLSTELDALARLQKVGLESPVIHAGDEKSFL